VAGELFNIFSFGQIYSAPATVPILAIEGFERLIGFGVSNADQLYYL
jgi:hypothetical protein